MAVPDFKELTPTRVQGRERSICAHRVLHEGVKRAKEESMKMVPIDPQKRGLKWGRAEEKEKRYRDRKKKSSVAGRRTLVRIHL